MDSPRASGPHPRRAAGGPVAGRRRRFRSPPANALADGDSRGSGPGDFLPGPSGQEGGSGSGEDCEEDPDADCEDAAQGAVRTGGAVDQGAVGQGAAVGQGVQAQSNTVTLTVTQHAFYTDQATLTIANHTGNWYFKADTAPYNTACRLVTGSSKSVRPLAGSATYTFSAYSDSACTTANLLATASPFTAQPVSLRVISKVETRPYLLGGGINMLWYYKADAAPYNAGCYSRAAKGALLLDLLPNTSYTFSAYSDSACTEANRLVTAAAVTLRQLEPLPQCGGIVIRHELESTPGQSQAAADVFISNETDIPVSNVEIELFRLVHSASSTTEYKNSFTLSSLTDLISFESEGTSPDIAFTAHSLTPFGLPTNNPDVLIVDLPELPANSTYKLRYGSGGGTEELNAVVTVSSGSDTPVTVCRSHDSAWMYSYPSGSGYPQEFLGDFIFRMTVDDPLPATDGSGSVNFKISILDMQQLVAQSCVKLDISSGLTQNGAVTYTPATGTGSVMEYEDDGADDYKRGYTDKSYITPHIRWGLCSGADGSYDGGIYHVGYWNRYRHTPNRTALEITVPFTVKSGVKLSEQCVTAAFLYLPIRYSADGEKTSTVCLGAQPAGKPPVLLRDGRADIVTLYKCASGDVANGGVFPCQGKAANDLALYVDGYRLAAEDTVKTDTVDASGSAAERAGASYRLFRPEDVVIHVPDNYARRARKDIDGTTYPAGTAWRSGNDEGDDPTDNNDYGYIPGVSTRITFKNAQTGAGSYARYYFSACPEANENATESDHTNQTNVCNTAVSNTNPGPLRANYNRSWSYDMFDMAVAQPRRYLSGNSSFLYGRDVGLGHVWDFSTLGTHVVEVMVGAKPHQSTDPWKNAVGRYTFHVGPAADLGVDFGGSVAMPGGKRAFTVIATSDATADVQPAPLHEGNKGAWKSLRPLLKITDGNGKVPANVTQHYARWDAPPAHAGSYDGLGSYDTTTGVWTLPEGFHGVAYLTLVADAPTGGVKASIDNPEWCENDDGSAAATATGRTDCEGHVTAPISGKHWGSYQVCVNTSRVTVALDASSKNACTTQNSNNTWHTAEVLDWNDSNDSGQWALGGGGLTIQAQSSGKRSVEVRWQQRAGADDYAIYRSFTNNLAGMVIASVADNATSLYDHEGLTEGMPQYYMVQARKGGVPFAMSAIAAATPRTPVSGGGSLWPGSLSGLEAARNPDNENVINVSWTAPGATPSGYDVEYQSRPAGGSWSDWTSLATLQAGTAYTLQNAGGGTAYQFRVRAVNVFGGVTYAGGWSTASVSPLANPKLVGNLTAARSDTNLTVINVTWNPPSDGTIPTSYEVEYRENGVSWPNPPTAHGVTYTCDTNTPVLCTFSLTGAKGASTYQFRVRTVTTSGGDTILGSWKNSGTVSRVSAPNQVTGLTAGRKSDDETKIDVSWTAPSSGTTPTGYDVEYRVNGSGDWLTTNLTVTGTTARLTGAAGNSTYQFRVRAFKTLTTTNEKLMGSWRTSGTVSRVGVPNRVTGLTATRSATDETKITVDWTAPSSGDTPTGYDVEYKQDGGSDWTTGATVNHPAVTHTFTVAGGSSYQYRVRAFRTLSTNEKLAGSWTTSSTVRALPAGPVTNLAATRNTTDATTIDVSWSASNRANGYDVQYRKNSGSWQWGARAANQTGTSYTQTDAGGVESYTFRVRGVSGVGNGDWAESGTVAPPPVGYHGAEVGPQVADGKMAWIKLKVTSGPWSFEYRNHLGDWSSCKNVASGSYTISNLRAPHQHIVEVFEGNGCSDAAKITRTNVYTIDVQDPILDGADFNYHTHKRPYPSMGEVGVKPSDCLSIEQHSHGWPGGGGGTHWHCPIYNAGSSSGASGQSGQPSGGATGQTGQPPGGAQGQTSQPSGSSQGETELTGLAAVMAAINAYFNGTGSLAEAYAALQSYYG